MNCFDCAVRGQTETAVAVCVRCGAGVCADDVQSHPRSLDQHATLGAAHGGETRTLLCASCANVLADHTLSPTL